MFKRANKITALLVAAASIMSVVPAMAADSTRLGTKDGTIEDAIAFKDGKYAYEGYRTDDDNKSVYFNDGSKDKELNDLTDATINQYSKYDASSTIAWDGNDEYLLDLTNGKVTDSDVASDLESTAADKLVSKLKKTDRYGSDVSAELSRITPNQFGDVWYDYTATIEDATGTKAIASADITTATITANNALKLAGVTFGAPSAGTNATYTVVLTGTADSYAALKLGGVQITAGATAVSAVGLNDEFANAIAAKSAALATAGYTVTTAHSAYAAGASTTTLTITKATVGSIADAVNDVVYLKSGDTAQVKVTGKGSAATTGYTTQAQLISQIKDADFDNFTPVVTQTATGLNVVFTQKFGSTYASSDLTNDFTGTGVSPTLVRAGIGSGVTSSNVYHGYTNKAAAYIDVDKTANIRVYNGSKMVKLDEFDEDANDDGVKAVVTDAVTIAQDKDYIYRTIDVNFAGSTVTLYNSKGTTAITTAKYLQKISKAQGDTEKDAYLPKTVETYEIDGTISGDADTAATKLATFVAGDTTKVVGLRVVDDAIYYTEMDDSDTVKTYKLKLQKNEKVEAVGSSTKVDAYVVKKDADKDHDLKNNGTKAASLDVDGNLWIINEGKIYESVKAGDFTEMFTCDRSIDSLDVYDKGSLVAWDASGDVYTTVQEGTKVTEGEGTAVAPVVTTGWVQLADGTWNFNNVAGLKVTSSWINAGGTWYYLKADGVMATGWLLESGTWYKLNASGAMATGWVNDNGTWYYLNASGAMLSNTTVDGYVLGASGAWVK